MNPQVEWKLFNVKLKAETTDMELKTCLEHKSPG